MNMFCDVKIALSCDSLNELGLPRGCYFQDKTLCPERSRRLRIGYKGYLPTQLNWNHDITNVQKFVGYLQKRSVTDRPGMSNAESATKSDLERTIEYVYNIWLINLLPTSTSSRERTASNWSNMVSHVCASFSINTLANWASSFWETEQKLHQSIFIVFKIRCVCAFIFPRFFSLVKKKRILF